ncbi:hypothetical protein AWB64_05997 [Caballeronia sordidicola]|uniref:Lipoprotein n=1 Tax=Caballeronia sordidicola TaxID=196367 RepID=A0A158ID49_CABSO|nr:hypothetical protein AWB64_05997 [Caballeronia sordidicola]
MKRLLLGFAFVIPLSSAFGADAALSASEIRQILPGSTIHWIRHNGGPKSISFHADGSIDAYINPRAHSRWESHRAPGHWTVSDEGRVCVTEEWSLDLGGEHVWCSKLRRDAESGELRPVRRQETTAASEADSTSH